METLLTTRQVQGLLKVNRITIYRMLQDGRLKGSKIGQQWRFSTRDVEELLKSPQPAKDAPWVERDSEFPAHCMQTIQDVVSDLGHVSVITIDFKGQAVTEMSNSCEFCALMRSSSTGAEACRQSWEEVISDPSQWGKVACHAGLHFTPRFIHDDGKPAALLMAGHCRFEPYSIQHDVETIRELAQKHGLSEGELFRTAQRIPVLDDGQRIYVDVWLSKVADAFESILDERARFMERLQRITELSQMSKTE